MLAAVPRRLLHTEPLCMRLAPSRLAPAPISDVVALYVDPRGLYPERFAWWCLYDAKRDARNYDGPLPVIAHPPCQRWCRLAGLVEARWGLKRGEDGGLFEHALSELRRVGGVLEHPAYSDAWAAYGLPRPPTGVSYLSNHPGHRGPLKGPTAAPERRPRLTKKQARSTPPAFLDVLVSLARGAAL